MATVYCLPPAPAPTHPASATAPSLPTVETPVGTVSHFHDGLYRCPCRVLAVVFLVIIPLWLSSRRGSASVPVVACSCRCCSCRVRSCRCLLVVIPAGDLLLFLPLPVPVVAVLAVACSCRCLFLSLPVLAVVRPFLPRPFWLSSPQGICFCSCRCRSFAGPVGPPPIVTAGNLVTAPTAGAQKQQLVHVSHTICGLLHSLSCRDGG
jgi:hypothetical protein